MSEALRSGFAHVALLACAALAAAACTTLSAPASRPAPSPAPRTSSPAETTRSAPSPSPLPPPVTQDAPRAEPPPPQRGVDVPAARPQSDATGVSGALLEQSRAQRAAGSLPAARASLERALRLDPSNAFVWLELGELELQTGNAAQAATMARKAMTLAGRDGRVTARAERLLRAAE
jgi:tetratricopeptide (TPR) repeat protein